jgi:hypothetical protein
MSLEPQNTCDQAELISAYFDRQLDPVRMQQVAEHLTECPCCQKQIREYELIHQAVVSQKIFPPGDLAADLIGALEREQLLDGFENLAAPRGKAIFKGLAIAALITLAASASFILVQLGWLGSTQQTKYVEKQPVPSNVPNGPAPSKNAEKESAAPDVRLAERPPDITSGEIVSNVARRDVESKSAPEQLASQSERKAPREVVAQNALRGEYLHDQVANRGKSKIAETPAESDESGVRVAAKTDRTSKGDLDGLQTRRPASDAPSLPSSQLQRAHTAEKDMKTPESSSETGDPTRRLLASIRQTADQITTRATELRGHMMGEGLANFSAMPATQPTETMNLSMPTLQIQLQARDASSWLIVRNELLAVFDRLGLTKTEPPSSATRPERVTPSGVGHYFLISHDQDAGTTQPYLSRFCVETRPENITQLTQAIAQIPAALTEIAGPVRVAGGLTQPRLSDRYQVTQRPGSEPHQQDGIPVGSSGPFTTKPFSQARVLIEVTVQPPTTAPGTARPVSQPAP